MDSKRYSSSKSGGGGKGKSEKTRSEGNKSSARAKLFDVQDVDLSPVCFPVVKQIDLSKVVPCYTTVLTRSSIDGVGMEDLDQIQQDLEKLLSTSSVRHRLLRSELESFDKEERRERKGRPYDKVKDTRRSVHLTQQQSLKRKRVVDESKYRYTTKNVSRMLKTRYALPVTNLIDLPTKQKEILPEHDVSDKFWMSVEPYCQEVGRDNVCFLDDLIKECSLPVDIKIPDVGDHYASEWSENTIQTEQNNGSSKGIKKEGSDKKNNLNNSMMDTFPSPLTQRLLDTLLDEKVIKQIPNMLEKLKTGDYTIKSNNGIKSDLCLDRRLRKLLVEQGILDVEDMTKSFPPEDEILVEIRRCQEELAAVSKHNVDELNKLKAAVERDLKKQEVKAALDKVDKQVLIVHNKILLAKQTHAAELAEIGYSERVRIGPNLSEYEQEASGIIKQQIELHHQLTELTDLSLLE